MFRLPLLVSVSALVCLAGASQAGDDPKGLPIKLVTHTVKRESFQPQLIERGAVESADNSDVVCQVKPRSQTTQIATVIRRLLVEDGARVRKGQVLGELDSSGLEDLLKAQQMVRDRTEVDWRQAAEALALAKPQNDADVDAVKLVVQVAELTLEKYLKGDREQNLHDIKAKLLFAEADLEQAKENLDQAEAKLKQQEITDRQVRIVRLRLESARQVVESLRVELQTVEKYSRPLTELEMRGKVSEARRNLERMKQQAKSREALARQDMDAKKSIYEHEQNRCKEIEEEIRKCKLVAPRDGMVVYHVPEQTRLGTRQAIVAEGEPVAEGQ
jgi:multidrug efflux pump subunit AcrA (membrane-fusion protein)